MEFGVAGVVRLQVSLCPFFFPCFHKRPMFSFGLFVNLTFFVLSLVYRAADLQPSAVEEVEESGPIKREGRY